MISELMRCINKKTVIVLSFIWVGLLLLWGSTLPDCNLSRYIHACSAGNVELAVDTMENIYAAELAERTRYIETYPETIKRKVEHAAYLLEQPLYSDTYSQDTLRNTIRDYSCLESSSLEIGADEAVIVLESMILKYGALLLSLLVNVALYGNETFRLSILTATMFRGRSNLSLRRGVLSVLVTLICHLLVYGTAFLISMIYYQGFESLTRYVQSISYYSDFLRSYSVRTYLISAFIMKCISAFTIVSLLCFCCRYFMTIPSVFLSMVFLGIGWAINTWLALPIGLTWLKEINLYSFLHIDTAFLQNQYIKFCGHAVKSFNLRLITAGVYILIFFLLNIGTSSREPISPSFKRRFSFQQKYIPTVISSEIYRLLIVRKGLFILAAVLLLLFRWIDTSQPTYTRKEYLLRDFYETYQDNRCEADAYITNLGDMLQLEYDTYEEKQKLYQEGIIGETEYREAKIRLQGMSDYEQLYQCLVDRQQYLVSEEKRDKLPYVDDIGISELFKTNYQTGFAGAAFIITAFFCVPVFQSEKDSLSISFLLSLPMREREFFLKKCVSVFLPIIGIGILLGSLEILLIAKLFGFPIMSVSADAIPAFQGIAVPLWMLLLRLECKRILSMVAFANIFLLLGLLLPTIIALFLSMMVGTLPILLNVIAISELPSPITLLSLNTGWKEWWILAAIGALSFFLCGCMCCMRRKRGWS